MKLLPRYAQINSDPTSNALTNVEPADPNLPDIAPPASSLGPITLSAGANAAFETAPLTTSTPTSVTTPTSITSSTSRTAGPASATATPTASHGLSPGKLTTAIVVPIGFFAVLIPILVLWFLDHRRVVAAQKRASQRSSQRSAKAWETMPVVEKTAPVMEKEYRGSAPARPRPADPIPTRKPVAGGAPQIPPLRAMQPPPRSSLGLFNFELSPSSTTTNSRGSVASPRWRLSIARALELRRSEVAVTQVYNRSSGGSEHRPATSHASQQPHPEIHVQSDTGTTEPHNQQSETSVYNDPPPPYMSPRPSEARATPTHFAPLDRIGTRRQADRLSASNVAGQRNRDSLAPNNQRNTYASSDIIPPDSYGHVRTRSSSPSTNSSEGRVSAHNNGPFSYGLPERLSEVSRLSFDPDHWGRGNHQQRRSDGSDISALDSDDSSTMHPHQII